MKRLLIIILCISMCSMPRQVYAEGELEEERVQNRLETVEPTASIEETSAQETDTEGTVPEHTDEAENQGSQVQETVDSDSTEGAVKEFCMDVRNGWKGVEIEWTESEDATGYKVYRKAGSAKWKYLKTVSGTRYTDTSAPAGKKLRYGIRIVDRNQVAEKTTRECPKTIYYVKAQRFQSVENTLQGIKLKWTVNKTAGFYDLYRKEEPQGDWTRITRLAKNATGYMDSTVGNGADVSYRLVPGKVFSGTEYFGAYEESGIVRVAPPAIKSTVNDDILKLKVAWEPVPSVSGYFIQVSGSAKFTDFVTYTINGEKNETELGPMYVGSFYVRMASFVDTGRGRSISAWGAATCAAIDKGYSFEPSYDPSQPIPMVSHAVTTKKFKQNSMKGYQAAIDQGFVMLEGDLRFTKTGKMYMSHDPKSAGKCTSFEAYLDLCKENGVTALVHVKQRNAQYLRKAIDLIQSKGMLQDVVFQSTSLAYLEPIRSYSAEARIWLIVLSEAQYKLAGENAWKIGAEGYNIKCTMKNVSEKIVGLKKNGKVVAAYSVNKRSDWQRFMEYGCDTIVTDLY